MQGADVVLETATWRANPDWAVRLGYGELPVCIAKTQNSLSDDPTLLGRPTALPLALAPTGFTRMMQHEGEVAVGRAAARAAVGSWATAIESDVKDAHDRYLAGLLRRALERPFEPREPEASIPPPPPGSPIGCGFADTLR